MPNLQVTDLRPPNRSKRAGKDSVARPSSAVSQESAASQKSSHVLSKQTELKQLEIQLAEQSAITDRLTRENLELRQDRETVWRVASIFGLHGVDSDDEMSLNKRLEEFCLAYERQAQQEYDENNVLRRELAAFAKQLSFMANSKDLQLNYRLEQVKALRDKIDRMDFQTVELRKSVAWWRRERGLHQQQIEQLDKVNQGQKQEITSLNQIVSQLKAELTARPKAELERLSYQNKQQGALIESLKSQIQDLRQVGIDNQLLKGQATEKDLLLSQVRGELARKSEELVQTRSKIDQMAREMAAPQDVYSELESQQQTIRAQREQIEQLIAQQKALKESKEKLFQAELTLQENESLQWQVQALKQQKHSEKQAEAQQSREAIRGLSRLAGEYGDVAVVGSQLRELKAVITSQRETRAAGLEALERVLQQLAQAAAKQQGRCSAAERERAQLEAHKAQLEHQLEISANQNQALSEQLAIKEREAQQLRATRNASVVEDTRQQVLETSQLVQSVVQSQQNRQEVSASPSLKLSKTSIPQSPGDTALIVKLTKERDAAYAEAQSLKDRQTAFVRRHGEIKRELLAQIQELEGKLKEKQEDATRARARAQLSASANIDAAQSRDLEARIGLLMQQNEQLQKELAQAKLFARQLEMQMQGYEAVQKQKDERLKHLEDLRTNLQDDLLDAKRKLEEKTAAVSRAELVAAADMKALQDKLLDTQKSAEDAIAQRQQQEDKILALRAKVQEQNNQIQEMQKVNLNSVSQVSQMAQKVQDVQSTSSQLQTELSALNDELFKKTELLNSAKQEAKSLQKKIDQQTSAIEELHQALQRSVEDNQMKDQMNLTLKQRVADAAKAQLDAELTISQQAHQLAQLQHLKRNQKLATQLLEAAAVQSLLLETQADGMQATPKQPDQRPPREENYNSDL